MLEKSRVGCSLSILSAIAILLLFLRDSVLQAAGLARDESQAEKGQVAPQTGTGVRTEAIVAAAATADGQEPNTPAASRNSFAPCQQANEATTSTSPAQPNQRASLPDLASAPSDRPGSTARARFLLMGQPGAAEPLQGAD
jgi:hypothetical protein